MVSGAQAEAPPPDAAASVQAPPPPVYSAPPPPVYTAGPPAPMPPRKTSPVVWIVVGVLGFFFLMGLIVMIGFGLVIHKVKENPALAAAKFLTMANPNVEVVSSDSGRNTVTFRDKRTGETITMNFDDIKKGRIEFRGPKGERASIDAQRALIDAQRQSGTFELNTPDGSMKFGAGAGAKMPDWVPAYPGSRPEGTFSMQGAQGNAGTFKFTTTYPPQAVISFYEEAFKQAGFKITANAAGQALGSDGGMISAEDAAGKRNCMVMVSSQNGATSATLIFSTKP